MNNRNAPISWGIKACKEPKNFYYTLVYITVANFITIENFWELACRNCNDGVCYSDSAMRGLILKHSDSLKHIRSTLQPEDFERQLKEYIKNKKEPDR